VDPDILDPNAHGVPVVLVVQLAVEGHLVAGVREVRL
jgi:hypothetical protein